MPSGVYKRKQSLRPVRIGTLKESTVERELLAKVYAFLKANNIPETKFGRLSVKDPRLVHDIRLGRTLRQKTKQRVLDFIESYYAH